MGDTVGEISLFLFCICDTACFTLNDSEDSEGEMADGEIGVRTGKDNDIELSVSAGKGCTTSTSFSLSLSLSLSVSFSEASVDIDTLFASRVALADATDFLVITFETGGLSSSTSTSTPLTALDVDVDARRRKLDDRAVLLGVLDRIGRAVLVGVVGLTGADLLGVVGRLVDAR